MHHFLHRSDMIKILHIVPAEDQTIFYVTFYGTDQSLGDAVRSLGGITFFQTTEAVPQAVIADIIPIINIVTIFFFILNSYLSLTICYRSYYIDYSGSVSVMFTVYQLH